MSVQMFEPLASGGGAGGGGSALLWAEPANAAVRDYLNSFQVYTFSAGLAQELTTSIRIPSGYTAGGQVKLLIEWYSSDTSGNVLIQSQSTLIRAETDAVSSTTNQRTSTNSAVTMSGSNTNKPQKVSLDLTDTTGQVNSVSVNAGDMLKVRLYRDASGTDTATGDVYFVLMSAEPTFS